MFRRFSDPVLLERCDVQRTADQRDLRAAERGERRARFARREQRDRNIFCSVKNLSGHVYPDKLIQTKKCKNEIKIAWKCERCDVQRAADQRDLRAAEQRH